ncbi:hypothetical protein FB45DRAFT_924245 [Roridomyces roridus]|uniref:Uncharacterized protein n=1 Tax=Roridomyces roridus TaxID=1738132 RepID=A0AAD7FKV7_9AGAR|nr:hypothetical protein FB45DRAFT_924245 [Roridomyces roridus]
MSQSSQLVPAAHSRIAPHMPILSSPAVAQLPPYTPAPDYSDSLPTYHPNPTSSELVLEQSTTRSQSLRPSEIGSIIHKFGRDTLVLSDQDPRAKGPTYGRHGLICGSVQLGDSRGTVLQVILKLTGRMDARRTGSGCAFKKMLDNSYTLWSADDAAVKCPGSIPFTVAFPAQFHDTDEGKAFDLPPTYTVLLDSEMSGKVTYLKIAYSLSVGIVRGRGKRDAGRGKLAALLKGDGANTTNITVPLTYIPAHSIAPPQDVQLPFLPQESIQSSFTVNSTTGALAPGSADLHIQLVTPTATSTATLAESTSIPVHARLTGPAASLNQFVANEGRSEPKARVTASLVRKLLLKINGEEEVYQYLGCTDLVLLPPSTSSLYWAGELLHASKSGMSGLKNSTPIPTALVGSFDAGMIRVQDCIVISTLPASCGKSGAPDKCPCVRVAHSRPLNLDMHLESRNDSVTEL